jgi:hypothetical protein
MIRFPIIAALICALAVSACGTERANPLRGEVGKALKGLTKRKTEQTLTTDILRARLTPELRAQIGRPVLIAELPELKVAAVVIEVAQNGGYTTWHAGDGVGISTKAGLLTSSRGIGFDLMSADIDGPLAVIMGRAKGQATRIHRYLDGEGQEILRRFTCVYQQGQDQRRVVESCDSTGLNIENQYWLNARGQIWRSQQWAGERNGYILLESPK